MKKYTCITKSLLGLAVLVLTACDGIFIPDPIDPRLPKYTESGNNVAGAFVDGDTWKSVVKIGFPVGFNFPSVSVWPASDSVVVRFSGSTSGKSSDIEFHLSGLNITKFEDLLHLKNKKVQLNGSENAGFYIENYDSSTYDAKGIGQIYFKNVSVNDSLSKAVLSGTFGFSVNEPTGRVTKISYGRFDYRVTKEFGFIIEQN